MPIEKEVSDYRIFMCWPRSSTGRVQLKGKEKGNNCND
jgi:hypothetical protein